MTFGNLNVSALLKTTALAAVLSSVANAILTAIGWQWSLPPASFGPYQYSAVVGLTVLGVLGAGAVYAFLRYRYTDPRVANRYFIYIAIATLLVSFYPDLAMPWSSDADQVGWTYGIMGNLMLMHVVAAAIVTWMLVRLPAVRAAVPQGTAQVA